MARTGPAQAGKPELFVRAFLPVLGSGSSITRQSIPWITSSKCALRRMTLTSASAPLATRRQRHSSSDRDSQSPVQACSPVPPVSAVANISGARTGAVVDVTSAVLRFSLCFLFVLRCRVSSLLSSSCVCWRSSPLSGLAARYPNDAHVVLGFPGFGCLGL